MKVTTISLSNGSHVVDFLLADPTRSGRFLVKDITGLDADEIISRYYGTGVAGSGKYFDLSVVKRDISLRFQVNPNFREGESYSSLRDEIYKVVSASRLGLAKLEFSNEDGVIGSFDGFVTRIEAPQFDKTQEIIITFRAKNPMLQSPSVPIDLTPWTINLPVIVDNDSTAPHGFKFALKIVYARPKFKMTDAVGSYFEVQPSGGFLVNDILYFSSEAGDRYLYIQRGLTTIYLIDKVSFGSNWPLIFPGSNGYTLDAWAGPIDGQWLSMSHKKTYWGI